MRIVVAPDSFKGSASAVNVAAAMSAGLRESLGSQVDVVVAPMADGGEGTLEVLFARGHFLPRHVQTVDSLRRARVATYGLSRDGATAAIEVAQANGLPLVADVPLEPLDSDTYGSGLVARHVLTHYPAVRRIFLFAGGTASTDAGTGFVRALGVRFLGSDGAEVPRGGAGLRRISRVDTSSLVDRAREVSWEIAVDVENPLCGPLGTARVFAPQKGATTEDVEFLEGGLLRLVSLASEILGEDAKDLGGKHGFGAAGGLPLGVALLSKVDLSSGAEFVAEAIGLATAVSRADVVLTGEGRLDSQSINGKVVDAVRRLTPVSTPVIVVAGEVALSAEQCRHAGLTCAFSIAPGPASLTELSVRTMHLVRETSAHIGSGLRYWNSR